MMSVLCSVQLVQDKAILDYLSNVLLTVGGLVFGTANLTRVFVFLTSIILVILAPTFRAPIWRRMENDKIASGRANYIEWLDMVVDDKTSLSWSVLLRILLFCFWLLVGIRFISPIYLSYGVHDMSAFSLAILTTIVLYVTALAVSRGLFELGMAIAFGKSSTLKNLSQFIGILLILLGLHQLYVAKFC